MTSTYNKNNNMRKFLGPRVVVLLAVSALLSYSLRQQWDSVNTNTKPDVDTRDVKESRGDESHVVEIEEDEGEGEENKGKFDVDPATDEEDNADEILEDINDYSDEDVKDISSNDDNVEKLNFFDDGNDKFTDNERSDFDNDVLDDNVDGEDENGNDSHISYNEVNIKIMEFTSHKKDGFDDKEDHHRFDKNRDDNNYDYEEKGNVEIETAGDDSELNSFGDDKAKENEIVHEEVGLNDNDENDNNIDNKNNDNGISNMDNNDKIAVVNNEDNVEKKEVVKLNLIDNTYKRFEEEEAEEEYAIEDSKPPLIHAAEESSKPYSDSNWDVKDTTGEENQDPLGKSHINDHVNISMGQPSLSDGGIHGGDVIESNENTTGSEEEREGDFVTYSYSNKLEEEKVKEEKEERYGSTSLNKNLVNSGVDGAMMKSYASHYPVESGDMVGNGYQKSVPVDGAQQVPTFDKTNKNGDIKLKSLLDDFIKRAGDTSEEQRRYLDYFFGRRLGETDENDGDIGNNTQNGVNIRDTKSGIGAPMKSVPKVKTISELFSDTKNKQNRIENILMDPQAKINSLVDSGPPVHEQDESIVSGNFADTLAEVAEEKRESFLSNRAGGGIISLEDIRNRLQNDVESRTASQRNTIYKEDEDDQNRLPFNDIENSQDDDASIPAKLSLPYQYMNVPLIKTKYGFLPAIIQSKDANFPDVKNDGDNIKQNYPHPGNKPRGDPVFESPNFDDFSGFNIKDSNPNQKSGLTKTNQDSADIKHLFAGLQESLNSQSPAVQEAQNSQTIAETETLKGSLVNNYDNTATNLETKGKETLQTHGGLYQHLIGNFDSSLSERAPQNTATDNAQSGRENHEKSNNIIQSDVVFKSVDQPDSSLSFKSEAVVSLVDNDVRKNVGGQPEAEDFAANGKPIMASPGYFRRSLLGIFSNRFFGFDERKEDAEDGVGNGDDVEGGGDDDGDAFEDGGDGDGDDVEGGGDGDGDAVEGGGDDDGDEVEGGGDGEGYAVEGGGDGDGDDVEGGGDGDDDDVEGGGDGDAVEVGGDGDGDDVEGGRDGGGNGIEGGGNDVEGGGGDGDDDTVISDESNNNIGNVREPNPYRIFTGEHIEIVEKEDTHDPNMNTGYDDMEEDTEQPGINFENKALEISENQINEEGQNDHFYNADYNGDDNNINEGNNDADNRINNDHDNNNNNDIGINIFAGSDRKQTTTPNNNGGSYDNPRPLTQEEYDALHTLPYRQGSTTRDSISFKEENENDVVIQNENSNIHIEDEQTETWDPEFDPVFVFQLPVDDYVRQNNMNIDDFKEESVVFEKENIEQELMDRLIQERMKHRAQENDMLFDEDDVKEEGYSLHSFPSEAEGLEILQRLKSKATNQVGEDYTELNYGNDFNTLHEKELIFSDLFNEDQGADLTLPKLSGCPINLELAPVPHAVTALVVFPGALADWLRNSIEQLTGEPSDSLYNVMASLKEGDTDPFFQMPRHSVIHTHSAQSTDFDKAIVVITNPASVEKKHLQFLPFAFEWRRYFLWDYTLTSWLSSNASVLVLAAEDLIEDSETHLRKIASFLQIDNTKVDASLTCALLQKPPILIDDVTKISGVYSSDRERLSKSIDAVIDIASRKAPDILHRLFRYKTLLYM